MAYPGTLDSFTTKVDGQDDILAAHMNSVQSAIVAIETELGVLPKGSAADLVARLAVAHNGDGTLKTSAIVPGALSITNAMLAANSVDSSKIVDASITGADIAAATVTGSNIAAATIGSGNIANLAITTALHADASVTTAKLADAAVTGAKGSTALAVRRQQSFLGTIPTTGTAECYIMVPADSAFTGFKLVSKDALVGSDTNYLTVVVTDMGTNGLGSTVKTVGTAADTTKATGGTNGVVAYASTTFSVDGSNVTGGEVLKVVFTVTGTLPNTLTNCIVSATFLVSA